MKPENPDEPLIVAEKLIKRFSSTATPAIDTFDARIGSGRVTGLVGPDAAGKTTLMRLFAGLLLPSEGKLTVCGVDTGPGIAEIRQQVSYMPQRFGLYEDLSVAQNLNLYADLRNVVGDERKDAFERLLKFTDLKRFTNRLAGDLSGGMKQKLGLACALIRPPRLLLLDEPSVGVDPISRRELWKMVYELVDQGIGVVWSTSYLDEAERCAEVVLLNEGKVLYSGSPKELTNRVAGRCYLVAGSGQMGRRMLASALERPDVIDGVIQGSNVRLVMKQDAPAPKPADLGLQDAQIKPTPPRFEDAFVDLLGGRSKEKSALSGDESFVVATPPPLWGWFTGFRTSMHEGDLAQKPVNHRSRSGGVEACTPNDSQTFGGAIGVTVRDEQPVVDAEGLTKKFGDFTAADHITFKIGRGTIFGLLGPNGAGKSTTFKMMCGLLRPTEGWARVTGLDLYQSAGVARGHIGYMAQKFSLYGDLSARQNLDFFAGIYGLSGKRRRDAAVRMISAFKLTPYANSNAGDMPLGYKQRLALACAIMHDPAVLFLDEPTSGVDPLTRREFWSHINAMVERGVTIMVTTHFLDEAEYCDRIALVYQSRVIAEGSPDELKERVRSEKRPEPTLEDAFIELVENSSSPEAAP